MITGFTPTPKKGGLHYRGVFRNLNHFRRKRAPPFLVGEREIFYPIGEDR